MTMYLPLEPWETLKPARQLLDSAARIPLLTHEEEQLCSQLAEAGNIAEHALALRSAGAEEENVVRRNALEYAKHRTVLLLGSAATRPWTTQAQEIQENYVSAIVGGAESSELSDGVLTERVEGGKYALEHLTLANIRLCVRYVKRHASRRNSAEDLLQESYFYLSHAAQEYHYGRIGRGGTTIRFAKFAGQVLDNGLRTYVERQQSGHNLYQHVSIDAGFIPESEFALPGHEPSTVSELMRVGIVQHVTQDYASDEAEYIARRFGLDGFSVQELGQMAREMGMPQSWMQNRLSPKVKAKMQADKQLRALCEQATYEE